MFQHAGDELIELVIVQADMILLGGQSQRDNSLQKLKLERQAVAVVESTMPKASVPKFRPVM